MNAAAANGALRLDDVGDFSERIPPLVVKELRRALRSLHFMIPFALLPALLALVGIWVMVQDDRQVASETLSAALSLAVIIPFYLLKPLQALGALRQEKKSRTLDLLLASHLTPMRIVLGKWCGLEAQAMLYLAALLPFFVMRYFLGPIELVEVAAALFIAVAWAAFLTVLCLSISSFTPLAFGICLGILVLGTPLLALPPLLLVGTLHGEAVTLLNASVLSVSIVGAICAFGVGIIALSLAASRISPERPELRDPMVDAMALPLPGPVRPRPVPSAP